jgi:hypothetical protein
MVANAGGQGSLIGVTIGGYQVEALIGRGAMGAVYLARDVKLNRMVALKVLLGSLAKTPSQVKEFLQEAQTAAPLHHPGIVRIYSAGVEEGTPYIAMEFVNGEPLDRFLKRKGALKWDVALQIGRKLSTALDSAHKAGVVHRDIKPANIMLDQEGGVRLTDFGIAKVYSDDMGDDQGRGFLGTPQYMSPEQARGEKVTPSGDLYSLGVTLYQMMSGELPFTGESSMALINSICNDEAPRLNKSRPEIPDDVARFVAYLMGKTPKERPANAKVAYSMIDRLQKLKGELNTMTDGLTGFIQDEMEIRPFQSLHQPSTPATPKKTQQEANAGRFRATQSVSMGLRVAAVAVLAIGAFALGSNRAGEASIEMERQVFEVAALSFRALGGESSQKMTAVQMPKGFHEFTRVQWLNDSDVVWVETRGTVGIQEQATIGTLGIDMDTQQAYTVVAPTGTGLEAGADQIYLRSISGAVVVSSDESHPFAHRVLVAATDPDTSEVVVLSRRWDRLTPDPTVLLRLRREQWVWDTQSDLLRMSHGRAVISPDGTSVAYVLFNPEGSYSYVVQQQVDDSGRWTLGEERTSAGNDIIPASLRFSPDGSSLFYMRRSSVDGSELWRMSAAGDELNGDRVLSGIVGTEFSVSAGGDLLAASVLPDAGGRGEAAVVLVQTQTGRKIADLGVGQVSDKAFHPTEPWLIVNERCGDEAVGIAQLRIVNTGDVNLRKRLTEFTNGMGNSYAFSGDGRYIAAVPTNPTVPSIIVIEWNDVVLPDA